MLREVKPKNPRTARILKKREPQLIEPLKSTLLLHGTKCPTPLNIVLKTIHGLIKHHSILFQKKNENIHPFESAESIEFLASKNDCGLVVFGSSSRKRPNCVNLVRMFNSKVLEMCELLLLSPAQDGQSHMQTTKMPISIGLRPMIVFAGSAWEDSTSQTYTLLKRMFVDLFRGEETDKIDVEGLQYLMMVAAKEAVDGSAAVVHLRWYKIRTKRSGQKLPRVELDEIGPQFDFRVGRVREADPNLLKEAMKQGKSLSGAPKTKKNIGIDTMGDKIGRLHLGRQDLSGLQTRKMKGLKRRAGVESDGDSDHDPDMIGIDDILEVEGRKRPRIN